MLRAECYKQRMEKGLSFLEFNYMIMQSYDFYELYQKYGCNMQFGGNDQWSNMLGGTELIRRKLGPDADAYAMTITLLLNSEGKKMGKTQSGAVWLDPNKTSPFDFYQYWRNVADADVMKCIRMLTFLPLEEIDAMDSWEGSKLNEAKEILADVYKRQEVFCKIYFIFRREVFVMEKKNINWGELGFSYQQTEKRFVANFKDGAWDEGTLTEDATITLNECAGVFQYAQTCFEGLKAYTTENGDIVCFRPDLNAARMAAVSYTHLQFRN